MRKVTTIRFSKDFVALFLIYMISLRVATLRRKNNIISNNIASARFIFLFSNNTPINPRKVLHNIWYVQVHINVMNLTKERT